MSVCVSELTSVNVEYSLAREDSGVVSDFSQHPSHSLQCVDWVQRNTCLTHYVNHLNCVGDHIGKCRER